MARLEARNMARGGGGGCEKRERDNTQGESGRRVLKKMVCADCLPARSRTFVEGVDGLLLDDGKRGNRRSRRDGSRITSHVSRREDVRCE